MAGEHDYDINLDDKFGSLALIDLAAEIAAHEPVVQPDADRR